MTANGREHFGIELMEIFADWLFASTQNNKAFIFYGTKHVCRAFIGQLAHCTEQNVPQLIA